MIDILPPTASSYNTARPVKVEQLVGQDSDGHLAYFAKALISALYDVTDERGDATLASETFLEGTFHILPRTGIAWVFDARNWDGSIHQVQSFDGCRTLLVSSRAINEASQFFRITDPDRRLSLWISESGDFQGYAG